MHFDTVKERRENLDGFAVGQFAVGDLAERSSKNYDLEGIDIHIYDKESRAKNEYFVYKSRSGIQTYHPADEQDDDVEEYNIIKKLDVGGREWDILFHPTEQYITLQKTWQSKGFLAIGLIFTSIMVTYLFVTAGEASYVEQLVNERTSELAVTNKELESEVERHKLTGDALKESEENYRNIYNNAQVGLFRIKISDGEVINANLKFAQMFGYDTQQEVIAEFAFFDHFASSENYKHMLVLLQEEGEVKNLELPFLTKEDSTIWIRIWARIYLDRCYIEGVATDITEEKKVEKDNKQLQEQLLQSQKMESIGRLAGGIAHDFNNILTGIIGYAELALSELPDNHPVHRKLKIIETSSQKAAALTRQLLAFSRKQILDIRVINLNVIVENMSKLLERVIGDDIRLNQKTKRGVHNVKADPTQIEQILMNLVVNARDAMPDGGLLTIETKDVNLKKKDVTDFEGLKPGKYVMLSVSDTGVGLDDDIRGIIFEPFFTTKQKGKGTGLGLSTVFGIVKQHDGYIWVDSKLGEGTTFDVYFPIAKEEKQEAAVEIEKHMERGSETLLVVDDDHFVCNLMSDSLKPLGYNILTAYNAEEAMTLSYRMDGVIDLIITDVVMPGVDGKELVKQIKQKRPDVKVIYMSGYTDDVIVYHGVLKEGVEFIQKPLVPTQVSKRIREVLDRDVLKDREKKA